MQPLTVLHFSCIHITIKQNFNLFKILRQTNTIYLPFSFEITVSIFVIHLLNFSAQWEVS